MDSSSRKILIAGDIGNSRIKLLLKGRTLDSPQLIKEYFSFGYNEDKDWIDRVTDLFLKYSGNKIIFCYSSVNITRLEVLLSHLDELKGIRFTSADDLIESTDIIDFNSVTGMGTDRKLNLIGGLACSEPPFITIDAGTATTINVLGSEKKCLGGTIMPGIYTQIKSLAESTSGLNFVKLSKPVKTTAANTKEALRAGIIVGSFGAIKEITDRISREEFDNKPVPVIATGGGIDLLLPYLDEHFADFRVYKNLVLDGIEYLFDIKDKFE